MSVILYDIQELSICYRVIWHKASHALQPLSDIFCITTALKRAAYTILQDSILSDTIIIFTSGGEKYVAGLTSRA
jgi:hypothetical protein